MNEPPSISEIECEQAAREPVATIKGAATEDQDFMCLVGIIELLADGAPTFKEAAAQSLCAIYEERSALRARCAKLEAALKVIGSAACSDEPAETVLHWIADRAAKETSSQDPHE